MDHGLFWTILDDPGGDAVGPDPGAARTLADLARELDLLRGTRGSRKAKVGLDDLAAKVDLPQPAPPDRLPARR